MPEEEKLREIKIEQEPTQVTWRRCTQCNAAQMEFQLREDGICQECYISNLEKENAELKAQNEKMKCCGNCVNRGLDKYMSYPCTECRIWHREKLNDKWEFAD